LITGQEEGASTSKSDTRNDIVHAMSSDDKRQQTKGKLKVVMLKLLLKRKPKNLKTKNFRHGSSQEETNGV
jgi:hypothetical protein